MENVGIPNKMIYDGAPEQVQPGSEFQKLMTKYHIVGHQNKAKTQRYNRAEDSVRELKRRWKKTIIKRIVPKRLWDYGMVWEAEILSRMCRSNSGYTCIKRITGDTADISEWLDFAFYDLCWYWDVPNDIENPKIGRWLGVSHRVGSAMCYWILTEHGKVVAWTTVQHVTRDKIATDSIMDQVRQYHNSLDARLGDDQYVNNNDEFEDYINEDQPDPSDSDAYVGKDNKEPYRGYHLPDIDDIGAMDDKIQASNVYGHYIAAEVMLPGLENQNQMAKVVKRIKGNDGLPKGTADTSEYLIEFPDGTKNLLQRTLSLSQCFHRSTVRGTTINC